jgi:AcrR family transcriptional regulator
MPSNIHVRDVRVDSRYKGRTMRKRSATRPRKLPGQRRSRATVDALLTATAHILVRDGYEKANVNVIAKRAGCSIGSLYQYFPNKAALVVAVMRRHTQRMIDVFFRDLAGHMERPVPDAVRSIVEHAFDALAVDPKLEKVIVEQVPRKGLLALTRRFEMQAAAMLGQYLDTHRGAIRVRDLDLATAIVVHTIGAVAIATVVQDPKLATRARVADELTALIVAYVSGNA